MVETIQTLERFVQELLEFAGKATESEMSSRPAPHKWSKKEIIGHLIDSGINNLQRFSEISFEDQPYVVRPYKQEELVRYNRYQEASLAELLRLIKALNDRIQALMLHQDKDSLQLAVITPDGKQADLRFLMDDYVVHFAHHVKQLKA